MLLLCKLTRMFLVVAPQLELIIQKYHHLNLLLALKTLLALLTTFLSLLGLSVFSKIFQQTVSRHRKPDRT